MITFRNLGLRGSPVVPADSVQAAGPEPIWIDLLEPTLEEVNTLEKNLGIELPTKFDMEEIESSSRLYTENGALYMTALMLAHAESRDVITAPASFILFKKCLVTVRFVENTPFQNYERMLTRNMLPHTHASETLTLLLDAIIDRLADILERVGKDLDQVSQDIFNADAVRGREETRMHTNLLRDIMKRIGLNGEINSKARESLVSLNRLLVYFMNFLQENDQKHSIVHLKGLGRDLSSLSDHASYLSGKVSFLLDATLGLINIEQNQIIKIFSIASVIFLPPTLIASIYGMNFDILPEKHWELGYPFALILMVISAVLPCWFFRRRGWI